MIPGKQKEQMLKDFHIHFDPAIFNFLNHLAHDTVHFMYSPTISRYSPSFLPFSLGM